METGAHGFREPEGRWRKPAGNLRILVIGDSVSFGIGVPADSIFSAVLEQRLSSTRAEVEIINMGVEGFLASEELIVLQEMGLRREPDLVIWQLHLNDLIAMEKLRTPQINIGVPEEVIEKSRLLCWVAQRLSVTLHLRILRARYGEGRFDVSAMDGRTENFLETMKKAGRFFSQAHFPCMAVLSPYPDYFDERYPFAGVHQLFVEQCQQNGIAPVDLMPHFQGLSPERLWVDHPADNHPNGLGHRIMALALEEALKERYGPDLSALPLRAFGRHR
jgi:lysophospholipase L1-like esterase